MKIARTTSKREVYFSISAIARDWNNVFDFKWKIEDRFRCVAVFTSMYGSVRNGWVPRIHEVNSCSIVSARRLAPSNSASTSASSSDCSLAPNLPPSLRAAFQ